ncbi:LysR substrate-binding domain-containing protein [Sorangium sp. So ce233]|uniref:LysR substrate-binding domain-containing protein n=1 Tax=Sorangium sp. So ce233 TaxID=3133290 RepID=UPI003F5FD92E
MSSPTGTDRGTVRVTCSEVVGAEVLPPMLAALLLAHPRLQIELVATNRAEDLLRRDADVAVRMAEPTQAGLVSAAPGVSSSASSPPRRTSPCTLPRRRSRGSCRTTPSSAPTAPAP